MTITIDPPDHRDIPVELLLPAEKIERFLAPFDDYERGVLWKMRFIGPATTYEWALWSRAIELHERGR